MGGWPLLQGDHWNESSWDWEQSILSFRQFAGHATDDIFDVVSLFHHAAKGNSSQSPRGRPNDNKTFENAIVQAYHDFMVDVAVFMGASRTRATKEISDTMAFEFALNEVRLLGLSVLLLYGHLTTTV